MHSDAVRINQERLAKTARNAEKVQALFSDFMSTGTVYFRPIPDGVSCVSLLAGKPQRDIKIPNVGDSINNYREFMMNHPDPAQWEKYVAESQGRETGEKRVQSLIIRKALQNNRRMKELEPEMERITGRKSEVYFVIDELAIMQPNEKKAKEIFDILALRKYLDDGTLVPLHIEMKNQRAQAELIKQLNCYSDTFKILFDSYKNLFESILCRIVGSMNNLKNEPEKWAIWPNGKDGRDTPRKWAEESILVIAREDLAE